MAARVKSVVFVGFIVCAAAASLGAGVITPPDEACRCASSGEEHRFLNIGCYGSCEAALMNNIDDAYFCAYQPTEHPGCHSNYQSGDCSEHAYPCEWSSPSTLAASAIADLMRAGDEKGVVQLLERTDPAHRVRVNVSRNAIEIMDCLGLRPIGFFPASRQLQIALMRKASDGVYTRATVQ